MFLDFFSLFLPLVFLFSPVAIRQRLGDFNFPLQYSEYDKLNFLICSGHTRTTQSISIEQKATKIRVKTCCLV